MTSFITKRTKLILFIKPWLCNINSPPAPYTNTHAHSHIRLFYSCRTFIAQMEPCLALGHKTLGYSFKIEWKIKWAPIATQKLYDTMSEWFSMLIQLIFSRNIAGFWNGYRWPNTTTNSMQYHFIRFIWKYHKQIEIHVNRFQ